MKKKRRNYPGEPRIPGTKDYAVILTNLIKYKNEFLKSTEAVEAAKLCLKLVEKLQELGFIRASNKVARRSTTEKVLQNKDLIAQIALEMWRKGQERQKKAKEEQKRKQKEQRKKR